MAPPLNLRVRYWVAKRIKEAQRGRSLIIGGLALIVAAPYVPGHWAERMGVGLIVFAVTRWTEQQMGHRRVDPVTKKPVREKHPTLRVSGQEAEQIREWLESRPGPNGG